MKENLYLTLFLSFKIAMAVLSEMVSKKFKCWSFLTILTVVLAHSYNLNIRYLQPWTTPDEPLTFTSFTEYLLANGLFRFTMPLLFVISGFLYSMKDDRPNKQQVQKRFRTLLLPYFIWSAISIIMIYILETYPYTKSLIGTTHIAQMNDKQMFLHQYKWYDVLARWIFAPLSYQLWFIRVLFIYNLAYRPIRWCVLHPTGKWIFFSIATFLWLSTFGAGLIEGEGLLFFSLGVWIQKNNFDLEVPARWLNPIWWGLTSILLITTKTWLAFKGMAILGSSVYPVLAIMLKLSVFTGLIAAWYSSNGMVTFLMKQRWFTGASNYSFFIYVAHAPLVAIMIDAVFAMLHYTHYYRIFSFVLLPAMLVAGFIIIGFILKLIAPKLFGIMTGERGV